MSPVFAASAVLGVVVTMLNFFSASLFAASPLIVKSAQDKFLSIDASCLILTYPLNSLSNCVSSTVILSLIIISSNTGRKFAVSPTIDNVGVSSDASSPVTADILVLPMNRSPLPVSYTHLTLPTILRV